MINEGMFMLISRNNKADGELMSNTKSITNKSNNATNTSASNFLEKNYEHSMIHGRIDDFGVQSYQL